jgi:hypothetical protein
LFSIYKNQGELWKKENSAKPIWNFACLAFGGAEIGFNPQQTQQTLISF